jgi:hypothetical protein
VPHARHQGVLGNNRPVRLDQRHHYDPPEGWGWCYVDEVMLDLSDRATPHNGRIPRYY